MSKNLPVTRANDQLEHALLSAWSTQADAGICAVDENSCVVMLNPAACNMLGVNGLAMLNQPFKKLVAAVNFEPGIAQWLGTPGFVGERHATCESKGLTVDLLFKSTSVRMANSTGSGAHGAQFKVIAITDITQLLSAQRQVNSESYRRQWQALNAGVVISDARLPDMPIVYVNPMFEQMSGYASSEVLGRNCRFLQGTEKGQTGLAAIRTAIKTQSNGYAKLRNYRKDGSVFVNELFISPVKDGHGEVTHFVGIQHLENSQSLPGA
jgi:PAS domain S-box-containing protein